MFVINSFDLETYAETKLDDIQNARIILCMMI